MDHHDCPHYRKSEEERSRFDTLSAKIREEIETNMRELGLKPERMSSQVHIAALLGARAVLLAEDAALAPATYNEVSREGNVKPVTHPLYVQATSTATAYTNALKQLGIYASTEKVQTKAQEKTDADNPMSSILQEIGQ